MFITTLTGYVSRERKSLRFVSPAFLLQICTYDSQVKCVQRNMRCYWSFSSSLTRERESFIFTWTLPFFFFLSFRGQNLVARIFKTDNAEAWWTRARSKVTRIKDYVVTGLAQLARGPSRFLAIAVIGACLSNPLRIAAIEGSSRTSDGRWRGRNAIGEPRLKIVGHVGRGYRMEGSQLHAI